MEKGFVYTGSILKGHVFSAIDNAILHTLEGLNKGFITNEQASSFIHNQLLGISLMYEPFYDELHLNYQAAIAEKRIKAQQMFDIDNLL